MNYITKLKLTFSFPPATEFSSEMRLLEDYHSKNKIIAKKFEGVHQGSPSVVREYITTYGVNNGNHKPATILIYEEYFRWKSVLGIYALCAIGILSLVFVLLAKIKVY